MRFKAFEEFFEIPLRNGLTKPKRVRGEGYKMVNMGELFKYPRINNIPMDRVPLNDKELASSMLQSGDLLFARQSLVLEGAGQCSIFVDDDEEACFESHLIRCRLNKDIANPLFYYYFFSSQIGKQTIGTIVEQGAGASGIRGSDLAKVLVPELDIEVQDAIAFILDQIDSKIELNQQINQTLEQIAQAIFKSWFVDFEPVKAKIAALEAGGSEDDALLAAMQVISGKDPQQLTQLQTENYTTLRTTAELFPAAMQESELGEIPEGWEVNDMEEIVDIGSAKRVFSKEYVEDGVPFYRGKEVTELSVGNNIKPEIFIKNERYKELKEKHGAPKEHDILITSVGTIGNTYLVRKNDEFYFKDGNLTWIKAYKKIQIPYYLKTWFDGPVGKNSIENIKIGSTQQAITITSINKIKLIMPSEKIHNAFNTLMKSNFDKRNENLGQINSLLELRDTLLPKLLSGELVATASSKDEE